MSTTKAGRVEIEVAARLERLESGFRKMEKEALQAGRRAGRNLRDGIGGEGDGAAKAFLKQLRARFERDAADAREAYARRLIDKQELARQGKLAAQAFDNAVLAEIERRGKAGKLDDRTFVQLTRALKLTGRDAGEGLGKGLQDGAKAGLGGALTWIKGTFLLQLTQLLAQAGAAITQKLRDAVGAGEDLVKSQMRLATASRLFGLEQEQLNEMAAIGRREFGLNATAANELAVNVGKLAAKAGDASRAQELLTRALDLGAAQGYSAAEVAVALEQTLRGFDEGTDKLLQKNPSQIYEDYARSIGKTADTLTDAEQKQALMNAVLTEGEKVQGAYGNLLKGDLGSLMRWRQLQQQASETLGQALLPVLGKLAELMGGPLQRATGAFVAFLDRLDRMTSSPLENMIKDLRAAGGESERLLALQAVLSQQDLRREQRRIRATPQRIAADPDLAGVYAPSAGQEVTKRYTAGFGRERIDLRGIEYDLGGATKQELEAEIQRVNQVVDRLADAAIKKGAADRGVEQQAEALTRYREQLQGFVALREREVEITEQLGLAQKTLADYRAGKPGKPAPPTPPADPPTDPDKKKEIDRAREHAEDLVDQMRGLLAGLTTTALDEAQLALERFAADVRQTFTTLKKEIPAELKKGLERLQQDLAQRKALEGREGELQGLGAVVPTEESQRQLREWIYQLSLERDALAEGSTIREAYNRLLKQAGDLHDRNAKKVEEEATAEKEAAEKAKDEAERRKKEDQERREHFRDQARAIEENVRAALQLAEAFGAISEETARALEHVVQLGVSIARIVESGGADMGAWLGAAGSLAQLGAEAGLWGEDPDAKQLRDDQLQAMGSLTRALKDLEKAVLQDVSTKDVTRDIADLGRLAGYIDADDDTRNRDSDVLRRQALADVAVRMGLADGDAGKMEKIDSLKAWAEELDQRYGTNLAAFVANSDPEGLMRAVRRLQDQLREEAGQLGTFGDDVAGVIERITWEFGVLGRTDAAEKLRAVVEALKAAGHSAGQFQDELEALAGLDLSTAEGRARRDEIIAEMTREMLAGGANLGDYTAEELRRLIEEWSRATSGGGGGVTGGGENEARLSVSITEAQANQLIALESTQVYHLAGIHALLAGGAVRAPVPASFASPAPTPAGASAMAAAASSLTLTIQHLEVQAPPAAPGVDPRAWGREVGLGVGDGLAERIQRRRRALGASTARAEFSR